jgi:CDP-diacylglycerol---serine O-phosphatidyltransferase
VNPHPLRRIDDLRKSPRVRKGVFLVPSLFTAANMGAGYFAISQCIIGVSGDSRRFDWAAIAIGFAAVFDFFDGLVARMTGTSSDFGKEFDSLADVITFGVAPGILAYMWGFRFMEAPAGDVELQHKLIRLGAFFGFLFLVASASRLARFNIAKDPQPSNPGKPGRKYFVGMPTPAGAGVIAAVVHFSNGEPIRTWWLSGIFGLLIFATGYLEVSTWRFPSLKGIDWKKQQPFTMMIGLAALIAGISLYSQYVLFFIALTYMLSGVMARLVFAVRRAPAGAPTE